MYGTVYAPGAIRESCWGARHASALSLLPRCVMLGFWGFHIYWEMPLLVVLAVLVVLVAVWPDMIGERIATKRFSFLASHTIRYLRGTKTKVTT